MTDISRETNTDSSSVIPLEANNRMVKKGSNPFLKNEPRKLVSSAQKRRFLDLLVDARGHITVAAKKFGVGRTTVYQRLREDSDFSMAVNEIRKEIDEQDLAVLAELSINQAMNPKNVTERIFNLNALDPSRYRPKPQAPQLPPLNITFGFAIPRLPNMPGNEVPAEVEVVEPAPTKAPRQVRKHGPDPEPVDPDKGIFDSVKDVEI